MARSRQCDYGLFIAMLVPIAVIRFAIFAPFGYYWAYASTHRDVIQDHVKLHNGTYNLAFVSGEKIAAKWGTFAFYWNFAVWIPSFWFPPPLNLPFLVIDTVITVYLSIATKYQTGYAPQNKHACDPKRNHDFLDLQRPPGVNESFYVAAARYNATATTPKKMCESFVEEWQYGVALCVLYTLLTLLNMLAFFGSLKEAKAQGKSFRNQLIAFAKGAFACVLLLPKAVLVLIAAIFYLIPEFVFRCLPLKFKSPVRFGRRHVIKAGLGLEQATEMKVMDLTTEIKNTTRRTNARYQGGDGTPTPLTEFLGIYDMLMLVTQQLHYLDVVNLSRVSKSVREAALPAHDFDRRLNVFKLYTCRDGPKSSCWTCSNQICGDCQRLPSIPQTTLLHHLDNCIPYCTPCYNTHINKHRPPRNQRLGDPFCNCAPAPAKPPNFVMHYINGSAYYTTRQTRIVKTLRPVCQECNVRSAAELLQLRESRTKRELMEGRKASGEVWTKCAKAHCGKNLGTGPRWWICNKTCGKECTSLHHGAWGTRVKEKDGAIVEEEAI